MRGRKRLKRHVLKGQGLQTRFKTGHMRLPGLEAYLNESVPRSTPPQLKPRAIEKNTDHEYFVTHRGQQELMWNESFAAHKKKNQNCIGYLRLDKRRQAIISTEWRLCCELCSFKSNKYPMFIYVPSTQRGQRSSSLNLALGAALIRSPIGPEVCREILMMIGINPGSKKGLQMAMNTSGRITVMLGLDNLLEEQANCKEIRNGKLATISEDCRYNNSQFASSAPNTFQAATQAVSTFVSHTTDKVIDVVFANKHCPVKWSLQKKNIFVECPDHDGCLANMKYEEPIGNEGKYTAQCARRLREREYGVGKLSTDRDSQGGKAFVKAYGKPVELLTDPVHLSRGQKKAACKIEFSQEMLGGGTASQRSHNRNRFCEDVKLRCTAEFNAAVKLSSDQKTDDAKKEFLIDKLRSVPFTMTQCYQGNHYKCQAFSSTCKPAQQQLWPKPCLPVSMKENINMNDADELELRSAIRLRLGPDAISKTYENVSTNKCESMNKAYSKTNPKSVLSTRNFEARILSATLTCNVGIDEACHLVRKGIQHTVCRDVIEQINAHAKEIRQKKELKKTPASKMKRISRKRVMYDLHNKVKAEKKDGASETSEDPHYRNGLALFEGFKNLKDEPHTDLFEAGPSSR